MNQQPHHSDAEQILAGGPLAHTSPKRYVNEGSSIPGVRDYCSACCGQVVGSGCRQADVVLSLSAGVT